MTNSVELTDLPPSQRILVACIGNIFLGDDGFGVEVAQHLLQRRTQFYPKSVQVVDFGIRGIELAYTLLDEFDALVLVDATPRGHAPGTLYLLEAAWPKSEPDQTLSVNQVALDAHSMDPVKVLTFARNMGAQPVATWLVGCEPATPDLTNDYDEMQMGLSEPVQNAVGEAVKMVDMLVLELLRREALPSD
jgi:hydrogenase maturation protease